MDNILKYIIKLKKEWSHPREPIHKGEKLSFPLTCTFSDCGVDKKEISELDISIPQDFLEFWKVAKSARLYEDKTYGQWGLEILSPSEAINETKNQIQDRPRDFKIGDLVIGRFIGDLDLLLIRCSRDEDDYGHVMVALPLDPRSDWYFISNSFDDFLDKYINENGDKYWE